MLGLVGSGCIAVAVAAQEPAPPQAPSTAVAVGDAGASRTAVPLARDTGARGGRDRARSVAPVLPESPPVEVRVPALGLSAGLVRLGLQSDRTMEVPKDPARVGWYTGGPSPGARGPAVLAGHVTWNRKPAVFFRLAQLRPGDEILVKRADGRRARFAVTEVGRYPKEAFPTVSVYRKLDYAGLRLITCGGTYDTKRSRYADNVVVYADLVDAPAA